MSQCRVLVPVTHPVGGIRTYLIYNLKHLHEAGYRFTFLAPAGNDFAILKNDTASWEGTEYIDIPRKKNGQELASLAVIWQTLRTQRFDLIHSQGIRCGTLVALTNFFRQIPHLMTLHDVIIHKTITTFGKRLRRAEIVIASLAFAGQFPKYRTFVRVAELLFARQATSALPCKNW